MFATIVMVKKQFRCGIVRNGLPMMKEHRQSMCGIVSNRLPAYGPVAVRGFPSGHNLIFQVSQVSA